MEAPSTRPQNEHLPEVLRTTEEQLITARRATAGVPEAEDVRRPVIGLALSGGGIRSATLSLGIVQTLARRGLLPRIDYLSTVSGGGYFGSFLGALFARPTLPAACAVPGEPQTSRHEQVRHILTTHPRGPLHWLRENGRFLTPNGSGDVVMAVAIALRNWLAVLVVMITAALTAFLTGHLALYLLDLLVRQQPQTATLLSGDHWVGPWLWWSPWLLLPALFTAVMAIPTGWAYWLVPMMKKQDGGYDRINSFLPATLTTITAAVSLAFLIGNPVLLEWLFTPGFLPAVRLAAGVLLGLSVLTLLIFLYYSVRTGHSVIYRNHLSKLNAGSLLLVAGSLAWALIDTGGRTLYALWSTTDGLWPWIVGGATFFGSLFAVVQRLSPVIGSGAGSTTGISMRVLAGLLAAILHTTLLCCIAALAYGIVHHGQAPVGDPGRRLTPPPATVEVPLITDGGGTLRARMPQEAGGATAKSSAMTDSAGKDTAVTAPAMTRTGTTPHLQTLVVALLLSLFASLGYARIRSFVNQSSLAHTYATRLTRSYLGASNPRRQDLAINDPASRATNAVEEDDLHLRPARGNDSHGYAPHRHGGPLHLINITINETVDGRTGIQQLDRKGLPLAIGPAGVSVGVRHHAVWDATHETAKPQRDVYHLQPVPRPPGTWSVFDQATEAEALTLGQLVGISGAAFSTGIGSRTSLALSLLCGLFNVRTGHWWRSGTSDRHRRASLVQRFLFSEWTARFPGTKWGYWYLSDGGHFENLACYELIRRRVPFIICCDHGEDPAGELEDLGGLVRKARMDFGAELTFLTQDDLHQVLDPALTGVVGSLEQLRSTPAADGQPPRPPTACAAIGRLRYADGSHGTLVFIKPGLIGGEPEDVRYYQRSHPVFPHEPTLDQFFDEAQWESYRRLGEHLAEQVFGRTSLAKRWNPGDLTPLA